METISNDNHRLRETHMRTCILRQMIVIKPSYMNYGVINEKPNSNEANIIRDKVFVVYVALSWNVVFEIFSIYGGFSI